MTDLEKQIEARKKEAEEKQITMKMWKVLNTLAAQRPPESGMIDTYYLESNGLKVYTFEAIFLFFPIPLPAIWFNGEVVYLLGFKGELGVYIPGTWEGELNNLYDRALAEEKVKKERKEKAEREEKSAELKARFGL